MAKLRASARSRENEGEGGDGAEVCPAAQGSGAGVGHFILILEEGEAELRDGSPFHHFLSSSVPWQVSSHSCVTVF